ncbi:MAG: hypothetical protein HY243_12135 [Proteobacteria bacterium]|nr:hypothetical protein [Pseudomonadota bacterium]
MARKLLSQSQLQAVAEEERQVPKRVVVSWKTFACPTRAHVTAVLTAVMRGSFTISLDKRKASYTVMFLQQVDLQSIVACPSFKPARDSLGSVDLQDLEDLANGRSEFG